MRKAHLFEALYLVNQGVDEAVRGLERLQRSADFREDVYGDALAKLESRRAHVNLQFSSRHGNQLVKSLWILSESVVLEAQKTVDTLTQISDFQQPAGRADSSARILWR